MNLQEELAAMSEGFAKTAPQDTLRAFDNLVSGLKKSGIVSRGPQIGDSVGNFSLSNIYGSTELGDKIENFTLANPWGEKISLDGLLEKGPVVINFYRGNWCPYCNVELRALEQIAPEIRELGANLVAISLEKPDESLKTIEKHNMQFIVLSDISAAVAKQFKILFQAPKWNAIQQPMLGIDIAKHNGANVANQVIPATYVIDTNKTVKFVFADEDFTRRANTNDILKTLRSLK